MSVTHSIAKDGTITFSISTNLVGSLLQQEEHIQEIVNELGRAATQHAMSQLDLQYQSIKVGETKYTRKNEQKKSTTRPLEKQK